MQAFFITFYQAGPKPESKRLVIIVAAFGKKPPSLLRVAALYRDAAAFFAKRALMKIPSLEEYEREAAAKVEPAA
jgi:hypothetical protein